MADIADFVLVLCSFNEILIQIKYSKAYSSLSIVKIDSEKLQNLVYRCLKKMISWEPSKIFQRSFQQNVTFCVAEE